MKVKTVKCDNCGTDITTMPPGHLNVRVPCKRQIAEDSAFDTISVDLCAECATSLLHAQLTLAQWVLSSSIARVVDNVRSRSAS